jgi:hypothetical protein
MSSNQYNIWGAVEMLWAINETISNVGLSSNLASCIRCFLFNAMTHSMRLYIVPNSVCTTRSVLCASTRYHGGPFYSLCTDVASNANLSVSEQSILACWLCTHFSIVARNKLGMSFWLIGWSSRTFYFNALISLSSIWYTSVRMAASMKQII